MKILKEDLNWDASEGVISTKQVEALWKAFEGHCAKRPTFDLANVSYMYNAYA